MTYFTPESFAFLRELRENNNRDWFAANKQRYEREVRDPALRFISDFGPHLLRIAPRLVADPRRSMFRIYRDTRFSRDKSPYKTHVGIHFFHEKAKAAASVPGFYLHISPGESFAAAGIWHPDPRSLGKVREAIAAKSPITGKSAKHAALAAQAKTTMARCAPVRSASAPQAAGATMRASCGSASTHAICAAPRPRAARYGGR